MPDYLDKIRVLGDPVLRKTAREVKPEELAGLKPALEEMWSLILSFRAKYGFGRAIAAPQIGLSKRIICLYLDTPIALINPVIQAEGDELMELWDDCMSFPYLLVRLKRHKKIRVSYTDVNGQPQEETFEGDLAELLQHEYDHLDGILAIDRAPDSHALKWKGAVEIDYFADFDSPVTICDRRGIIQYMNAASIQQFEKYGGIKLLGSNLLECHPEPSRTKLQQMLETGETNTYTTESKGKTKLIHQAPWKEKGEFRGIIEIGLVLPPGIPNHLRE